MIWFFWERINMRNLKRKEREVERNQPPIPGVRFQDEEKTYASPHTAVAAQGVSSLVSPTRGSTTLPAP